MKIVHQNGKVLWVIILLVPYSSGASYLSADHKAAHSVSVRNSYVEDKEKEDATGTLVYTDFLCDSLCNDVHLQILANEGNLG